jgi:hypothetical protein
MVLVRRRETGLKSPVSERKHPENKKITYAGRMLAL